MLLPLASCERENTRVINKRRAAVSAKLDQIQNLRAAVGAVPPVVEGKLSIGTAPLVMTMLTDSPLPTGTVVYEQVLEDLQEKNDAPPHYRQRIARAELLEDCGSLLAKGGLSPNFDPVNTPANVAQQKLDACANIEYIFVLRTKTMEGREFAGDLVAFEVASGKYLGGFPIAFTSEGRTDTVTSTTRSQPQRTAGRRYKITTKTVTSTVNADAEQVRSDLADEVEGGIKHFLPDVRWLN